jgi:hypothetical protein
VGIDDDDMARAVQRLAELGGGLVVIAEMGVQAELPLRVAGLLSVEPYEEVVRETEACVAAVRELGCTFSSPFQMMAFLALSVIPKLKITDRGLIDVGRFEIVPLPTGEETKAPNLGTASNPRPAAASRSLLRPQARHCPPHRWRAPARHSQCFR